MTDRRPVDPLLGTLEAGDCHPTAAAALRVNLDDAAGDGAAADNFLGTLEAGAEELAAAAAQVTTIYAYRIDCVLHILHLAVTAGLTSPFFMGPLGKSSWHEGI